MAYAHKLICIKQPLKAFANNMSLFSSNNVTVVHPISTLSNRRQNFRLPADVKRANRVGSNDIKFSHTDHTQDIPKALLHD